MKTYILNIELINDYLNNSLSQNERQNFESKLKHDLEFNSLYENQIVFVNGLSRIPVKADILKAKRNYLNEKWLKITGISIVVLGILVMLYTVVFNTSEIEPAPNNDNFNTIILDSVPTEKTETDTIIQISEEKTDSVTTASETEVRYTTTTINEKFGSASTTRMDLVKRAQGIRFNSQKDTTIRCKEGTILKIAKGSFINAKTKKPITGTIDLNVTEYYQLSDILMANLSTVSNGKQLETGGMLYIEARQGNSQLELKNGKSIDISFPTENKKPGMQLFSGEWEDEIINWNLENIEALDISEEELEEDIDVPFSVVEQIPTFPGCKNEDYQLSKQCTIDAISKFVNKNFSTEIAYDLDLTGRQRINCIFKIDQNGDIVNIQSRASHPRLSEEANRVIGLLPKMIPGMQRGRTVNVPYSLPIVFKVDGAAVKKRSPEKGVTKDIEFIQIRDTMSMSIAEQIKSGIEMDTIYNNRRGMVEFIREVMHDKDFVVDSLFMTEWDQFKKQKLIRSISLETTPNYIGRAVILRQPLFEMNNTRFKILEDDSITRGGHIIRVPWDETQIPTTTRIMNIIPKRKFHIGNDKITSKEFEDRLSDSTDRTMSSRDASYYLLKSSTLGWINCDRFSKGRSRKIKYKLKIKNADGANISMVFKSINSVLPSRYAHGIYDFKIIGANEDVVLVAIKRKNGKLYYDFIETTTEENPKLDFDFKEVDVETLKNKLEQLNGAFD